MGCLFSPDMTDAAHYAADRTLLALHTETKPSVYEQISYPLTRCTVILSFYCGRKKLAENAKRHISQYYAWQVMDLSGSLSITL